MTRTGGRTVGASVKYGPTEIPISVDFGNRKRLYIQVNPDQSVLVKAPREESLERVLEFAKQRAPWIFLQRKRYEYYKPLLLAGEYREGASWFFLGKRYRLQLVAGPAEGVELGTDTLQLTVADLTDSAQVRMLLEQWYIDRAAELFTERLAHCFAASQLPASVYPDLYVQPMTRSWGTCSARGWVRLNSELVKTPLACVDYVITHELCHLRHRNHSKAFYTLLGSWLPDWRRRKEQLDQYVI